MLLKERPHENPSEEDSVNRQLLNRMGEETVVENLRGNQNRRPALLDTEAKAAKKGVPD